MGLGWMFSIALFVLYLKEHASIEPGLFLFTSGLFAIAGSIGTLANRISLLKNNDDDFKK